MAAERLVSAWGLTLAATAAAALATSAEAHAETASYDQNWGSAGPNGVGDAPCAAAPAAGSAGAGDGTADAAGAGDARALAARSEDTERADAEPGDPGPSGVTAACIDQTIADRLAAERARRGAVDRLFVKHARHELSAGGGYYLSDLYAGAFLASASYTYHMTETTAVEFSGAVTSAITDALRRVRAQGADVAGADRERVLLAETLLVWTPLYGKLRLGGETMRFDIHLDAGFGAIDAPTARGLSGVAGAGARLFLTDALALRAGARDHIHREQLLDSSFVANDLSLTLGLAVLFPPGN